MSILWLKFPDEIVFYNDFTPAAKQKLESIFSVSDAASPWCRALEIIGLEKPSGDSGVICWNGDSPYFNWSFMMQAISGGGVAIIKKPGGGYGSAVNYRRLWQMLKSQWKLAGFLAKVQADDKLTESIALGLVLQSLVMRLGEGHNLMNLWLANPAAAPKKYRQLIAQIQEVQMRRTRISGVWAEIFPPAAATPEAEKIMPEFFWDDEIMVSAEEEIPLPAQRKWQGLPVCAGEVAGLGVAVVDISKVEEIREAKRKYNAPLILVFRHARPETTELFQYADAVLYAEGGVLSHACTVIREMNIPCITNLKSGFFSYLKERENTWLKIDASAGVVELIVRDF